MSERDLSGDPPEDDQPSWAPFGPSSDDEEPAPTQPSPTVPLPAGDAPAPPEPPPAEPPPAEPPPAEPPPAEPPPARPPSGEPSLWSGGDPVPAAPSWPAPERPGAAGPSQQPTFEPPAPPALGQLSGLTPGDPLAGASASQPGSGHPLPPPPATPAPPPPRGSGTVGGTAWPPPHVAPAALERKTAGNAIAALVLGILGLIFCPVVCSVAAIALGRSARRQIDANPRLDGRNMAQAGIVLGVVGLVVFGLFVVFGVLGAAVELSN